MINCILFDKIAIYYYCEGTLQFYCKLLVSIKMNSQQVENNQQGVDKNTVQNLMNNCEIKFEFSGVIAHINDNFKNIWTVVRNNNNQINAIRQELKEVLLSKIAIEKASSHQIVEKKPNSAEKGVPNASNDGVSLNYSDQTLNNNVNPQNISQKQESEQKKQVQVHDTEFGRMSRSQILPKPSQNLIKANQYEEQKENSQQKQMLYNKIRQLSERIQNLEIMQAKQVSFSSKKFHQLNNEIQKNNEIILKEQGTIKKIQFEVGKFRDQLSDYKLKKQSKLMKMSSKINENGNNNSQQFNNYIIEKIQDLTRAGHQYATKQELEDTTISIQKDIKKIGQTLANTATSEQLNNIVLILSKKIKNINKFKVNPQKNSQTAQNAHQMPIDKPLNPQANALEDENQDDTYLNIKLLELEKTIKLLQTSLLNEINTRDIKIKGLNQLHQQKEKKISQIENTQSKNQIKIGEHEVFMKKMNASYNQKFTEIQNQIIETQESVQTINNKLKAHSFVNNSTSSLANKSDVVSHQGGLNSSQQGKVVELQNQVIILKKKYNKIGMKVQALKEDFNNLRQDSNRQVEAVKSMQDKKCDWESLKKALNYFQERFKEVYESFDSLSNSIQPETKDETTAAKRGWTCLCCDKNIKQFEGKLSQAKFTSIFPARYESPRIGGYFRQKESEKQYKQIFISKNKKNSVNNYSALKSSSRDDLPTIARQVS